MRLLVLIGLLSGFLLADQYVHGYTRSNGTHVDGYYRSSPNNTVGDNFSTKGNVNPYTGQEGTKTYGGTYGNSYNSNSYNSNSFNSNSMNGGENSNGDGN